MSASRKSKRKQQTTAAFVRSIPDRHARRVDRLISRLALQPHGPGQVGIAFVLDHDSRVGWLPTSEAIQLLHDLDRGKAALWGEQLRTCPPHLSPILIGLPTADLIFAVLPDGGRMQPGSKVLS